MRRRLSSLVNRGDCLKITSVVLSTMYCSVNAVKSCNERAIIYSTFVNFNRYLTASTCVLAASLPVDEFPSGVVCYSAFTERDFGCAAITVFRLVQPEHLALECAHL